MATKESKSSRALQGERTLSKNIPYYKGYFKGSDGWEGFNGWFTSPNAGAGKQALMYETYFDLSGYELDDLTLLPLTGILQDPGAYTSDDTNTPVMIVLDILSQERLDIDRITTDIGLENVPSMATSPNDWNNITYGRYRLMMNTAEFNETGSKTWLVSKQDNFGSGSPCVVQKLWVYRYILMKVNEDKVLTVPASRFILNAMIVSEKDNVYLQRLRRNYETQGAVE